MSVLSRPRFYAQQRLDIEDLNSLLSALRSDSKAWNKNFLTNKNLIFKGFAVTGSATKQATIDISDAALVISKNTTDFSYYVSPNGATTIVLGDTLLQDNARNYLEISIAYVDSTPASKAFLDTNVKQEFNQIVNTMTEVEISVEATTVGFSGNDNKIPLAIVDTDINGDIRVIFDRRELFGRLSTPLNYENNFNWGSKDEPAFSATLSSVTGTFEVGELIDIGSEQATVQTVGSGTITFIAPTGTTFGIGSAVEGVVSGATATLDTAIESFTGVDKNITDTESLLKAIMTEIKAIKGTRFWYENTAYSLQSLISFSDAVIVQNTDSGTYSWDGSNLSITDNNVTPNNTDILAKLRRFGSLVDLDFTRQDGTGGSTVIAMANQQVLFTKIPLSGSRSFSGVGSADTNYQVVNLADFESTSESYWLAYREGTKLYIRGYGELETGESTPISDPDKETILRLIAESTNRNNQDRNLTIIAGGNWSLNEAGDSLVIGETYIQIPGLQDLRNRIVAQTISLPNVTSVAYVDLNRDVGADNTIAVSVANINSVVETNNRVVIARRTASGLYIGIKSVILLENGKSISPASINVELNKVTQSLRLKTTESNTNRYEILSSSFPASDGSVLRPTLGGRVLLFNGRQIDINNGNIYAADGVTVVQTFTMPTVAASQFRWASVSIVADTPAADNTIDATLNISFSSSDAASAASAEKPTIFPEGIHIGYFLFQRNAANTAFEDVSASNLIQQPIKRESAAVADGSITEPKLADRAVSARTLAVDANFPSSQYSLSLRQNITYISPATTVTIGFAPNRIRFINDRFIAVGNSGNAAHSIDGVTWTAITTGTAVSLQDVTYSKKYFSYYICGASGVIRYSNDLSTWTAASGTGAINYVNFIQDFEDQIVALPSGVGATNTVAISNNFNVFATTAMTGTTLSNTQIFYDTITKVAYAIDGVGSNTTFRTSTNFIAWTTVTLAASSNLQISTAVINGRVILPEKSGVNFVRLITSQNGTSKDIITSDISATSNIARGVGLYRGKLILAYTISGGESIQIFENGAWAVVPLPGSMNSLISVMFFDDLIIACGSSVAFANATFVSDNLGVTWNEFAGLFFTNTDKKGVAYNNNGRIVSGFGNKILVCGVVQTIEKNPISINRQGE